MLASANDSREYCQSWLAIQCRLIPAVVGGVVLLRLEGAEGYNAVAVWPDVRRDMSYLTPTAQQALDELQRYNPKTAAALSAQVSRAREDANALRSSALQHPKA